MGYRSDVVCMLYTQQKDEGRAATIKAWLSTHDTVMRLVEDWKAMTFIPNRGVKFQFDSIKWYDRYDDIRAFDNMLTDFNEKFCDDDAEYAYEFARIGEEDDDTVYLSSDRCEGFITIIRSISCDF